jgi:hypothetical protein
MLATLRPRRRVCSLYCDSSRRLARASTGSCRTVLDRSLLAAGAAAASAEEADTRDACSLSILATRFIVCLLRVCRGPQTGMICPLPLPRERSWRISRVCSNLLRMLAVSRPQPARFEVDLRTQPSQFDFVSVSNGAASLADELARLQLVWLCKGVSDCWCLLAWAAAALLLKLPLWHVRWGVELSAYQPWLPSPSLCAGPCPWAATGTPQRNALCVCTHHLEGEQTPQSCLAEYI